MHGRFSSGDSLCGLGRRASILVTDHSQPGLKAEAMLVLVDPQDLGIVGPVLLASRRKGFLVPQVGKGLAEVGGDMLTGVQEVLLTEDLGRLVDPHKFVWIVGAALVAVLKGVDVGTVRATNSYLAKDNWAVSSLDAGLDVQGGGLEEFNVLADQALVVGQVVGVAGQVERDCRPASQTELVGCCLRIRLW